MLTASEVQGSSRARFGQATRWNPTAALVCVVAECQVAQRQVMAVDIDIYVHGSLLEKGNQDLRCEWLPYCLGLQCQVQLWHGSAVLRFCGPQR